MSEFAQKHIPALRKDVRDDLYEVFKKEFESDQAEIMERTSTRWLKSIADTYADYGTREERLAALLVSLLVDCQRMAWSGDKPTHQQASMPQGLTTIPSQCDSLRNLFGRIRREIAFSPPLLALFKEVATRLLEEDSTLLGRMVGVSPDFREATLGATPINPQRKPGE